MEDILKFDKEELKDFKLLKSIEEILKDKSSMTFILEKLFTDLKINIIEQKKIITNNKFYIYRKVLISNNNLDIMSAISYIKSDFFNLFNIDSNNFLEKEFLGRLIFEKDSNKLKFGLTRDSFSFGSVNNHITRLSNFKYKTRNLIKLYEIFLPGFFSVFD